MECTVLHNALAVLLKKPALRKKLTEILSSRDSKPYYESQWINEYGECPYPYRNSVLFIQFYPAATTVSLSVCYHDE